MAESLAEIRIEMGLHEPRLGFTKPLEPSGASYSGLVWLRWNGNELAVIAHVASTDSKLDDGGQRAAALCLVGGVTELAKKGRLLPFQSNAIKSQTEISQQDEYFARRTISGPVDELTKAAEFSRATQRGFREAVQTLRELAEISPSGIKLQAGKIETLLDFVQSCLDRGLLGDNYGWYSEKMPRVRRGFDELKRRKSTTNQNYIYYRDDITRQLFNFESPVAWHREPPVFPKLD